MTDSGFFALRAEPALEEPLRSCMPAVVWLKDCLGPTIPSDHLPLVFGRRLDRTAAVVPLVTRDRHGMLHPRFDVASTADDILLERYHEGLTPVLEMSLPFNYSRLPSWVRAIGRLLSPSTRVAQKEIDFPGPSPAMAVEWLAELANAAHVPGPTRTRRVVWPNGHTSALVVTYDVDTDWLLRQRTWMDRFCTLEDQYGLRGAYYCVPMWCTSRASKHGLEYLASRNRELGVHGYNHDAKWPVLEGSEYQRRVDRVRAFAAEWKMRGFRSEWVWRTPRFLSTLADLFDYDSSVPSTFPMYTPTGNGCATCFPYITHGGLLELPLSLRMDEWRHYRNEPVSPYFDELARDGARIAERGGLIVVSLHPQQHQAANDDTFTAYDSALAKLTAIPGVWRTTPLEVARWVTGGAKTAEHSERAAV